MASSVKFIQIIRVSGIYIHVKGLEHETTEMARVTEGPIIQAFLDSM